MPPRFQTHGRPILYTINLSNFGLYTCIIYTYIWLVHIISHGDLPRRYLRIMQRHAAFTKLCPQSPIPVQIALAEIASVWLLANWATGNRSLGSIQISENPITNNIVTVAIKPVVNNSKVSLCVSCNVIRMSQVSHVLFIQQIRDVLFAPNNICRYYHLQCHLPSIN